MTQTYDHDIAARVAMLETIMERIEATIAKHDDRDEERFGAMGTAIQDQRVAIARIMTGFVIAAGAIQAVGVVISLLIAWMTS
jgi:hypothetical protein